MDFTQFCTQIAMLRNAQHRASRAPAGMHPRTRSSQIKEYRFSQLHSRWFNLSEPLCRRDRNGRNTGNEGKVQITGRETLIRLQGTSRERRNPRGVELCGRWVSHTAVHSLTVQTGFPRALSLVYRQAHIPSRKGKRLPVVLWPHDGSSSLLGGAHSPRCNRRDDAIPGEHTESPRLAHLVQIEVSLRAY